MRYVSTRGQASETDFTEVCLAGLASDGGLYVPAAWPQIAPAQPGETYAGIAARVMSAFAGDSIPHADIEMICRAAYASFAHRAVAPLTQWGPDRWLMELHHGPTLAFKDVAMQLIARLYDYLLSRTGEKLTIVCATSGDTGGAAAAAFAGVAHARLVILHPEGRISPVQRLFMTATGALNILNIAVEGDFDDTQALVKQMFGDAAFARQVNLSGVNSINWARIAAQSVYYAACAAQMRGGPLRFVVPSGNMGDAFAGYVAARCGLLNDLELVCAVNANDALARLFDTGRMSKRAASATPSPAMDISVPSNFERLLFELTDRDASAVRAVYAAYAQSGEAILPAPAVSQLAQAGLSATSVSNAETLAEMERFRSETGWLICPHTAVGTAVARRPGRRDAATVVLATAAAAKFPETVLKATGRDALLPARCDAVVSRGEVYECLPADIGVIRRRILAFAT